MAKCLIRFQLARKLETFPIISDVVNSSATPDSSGSRVTYSLFSELAIPLHETVDAQLAIRYEDSNDYGDATVGKFAIGWQPIDQVKLRYSASELLEHQL